MTIQEKAIEQLERISEHLSAIGEKEDYTDIAIKALEAQPCIEDYPTCTECEHYDREKHYCPRFCQVIKDTLAEAQPSEDCRNCKKWDECPCGKEGHENGTSIGYSIGECKNYEPCEDCISRQAVTDYIYNDLGLGDEENGNDVERQMELERSYKYIKSLPSVTPQRPKGKWIIIDDCELFMAKCSECGEIVDSRMINKYPYCHCGAEMSGGGEDEVSD